MGYQRRVHGGFSADVATQRLIVLVKDG